MARSKKRSRSARRKYSQKLQQKKASKALPLRKWDDSALHQVAEDITGPDEIKTLPVHEMIITMYENRGVGLAANQVGLLKRVIVFDDRTHTGAKVLYNPVIVDTSEAVDYAEEGCLSYPGVQALVKRHKQITVRSRDAFWHEVDHIYRGFAARIVQHEIDHLDAICRVGDEWRKRKGNLHNHQNIDNPTKL